MIWMFDTDIMIHPMSASSDVSPAFLWRTG